MVLGRKPRRENQVPEREAGETKEHQADAVAVAMQLQCQQRKRIELVRSKGLQVIGVREESEGCEVAETGDREDDVAREPHERCQ